MLVLIICRIGWCKLFEIRPAIFPLDMTNVLDIYREYVSSTSVSLGFQNNEEDFAGLEPKYNQEGNGIFLAWKGDQVVGCAAYRKIDDEICEMKRVYVRPAARGENIGRELVRVILDEARASKYRKICLDVLPEFDAALMLYQSFGFVSDDPITHNPVPGTHFLGLILE